MASISKLPSGTWRVQVRKKGVNKSATFTSKTEAQKWALAFESQIDAGAYSDIPKITFAELIDKYIREVTYTIPREVNERKH